MLAQCPRFTSGVSGQYAEIGTRRHKLLRRMFDADFTDDEATGMAEEDVAGIKWAVDYIRVHAPMSDYHLSWESPLSIEWDDFSTINGTPDCTCGPDLFDFKWRARDYTAQMAAYALGMTQRGHPVVNVHLLFGATQRAEKFTLTESACRQILAPILESVASASPQPTPCDYCGWCQDRLVCPALLGTAEKVANGYAQEPISWHPSKMITPEEIAMGLTVWRTILKPWGDSMEWHALESAQKLGLKLPGYELKTKRGREYCSDVARAFQSAGLPQETFLQCCDLRLNTSKSYPDKIGIRDAYAKQNGLALAPAKRELARRLQECMGRGNDSMQLVPTKQQHEENDAEL